ncbi:glycerol-3-phosphate 1-O-acyltransferase PlsY [bacterium]|nr:glycerol-3-phosphate 1-O-acyltransferase PlsY [bacterium]
MDLSNLTTYMPFLIKAGYVLLYLLFAYILGSISTGFIAVKLLTGQDIREVGSGSTGATNVKRVLGTKWFFIVLLTDGIKGILTVVLARYFFTDTAGFITVLSAVFVLLGHSKSVFLKFKGGKCVATGVGTILGLNPLVGLIVAAIWGAITYISKYVSLGSIIALPLSAVIMYFMDSHIAYSIYCLIGAIYIVWLHRSNIARLINNSESKVR